MIADWKQGLFGCFGNFEICLCGSFCPCILCYRTVDDTPYYFHSSSNLSPSD